MKPRIYYENHLAFPEVVSKALVTLINQQFLSINTRHLNNLHNTVSQQATSPHYIGHSAAHSPIPCSPSERLQSVLFDENLVAEFVTSIIDILGNFATDIQHNFILLVRH